MSSLSHWIVAPSWGYAQRHALNRSSTPARRGALMPEVIFEINRDLSVPMAQQAVPGHNRWHPDIPPANTVRPGATYRIECKDWTDNQVRNSDESDDIRDMNLDPCHVLSGPFAIEGAEPGDILVVDIVDIGPFLEQPWGYTGIFAKENGGGFLTDFSPGASKAIWDLDGVWTSSRHVPGVRFIGNSTRGCSAAHRPRTCWRSGTGVSKR